jgi:hypothetical protein
MAEQLFLQWSVSVARLNSVFGLEKGDQKPYNSSIKPVESRCRRPMRFLGFTNYEEGAPRQENRLFHYPPEAYGKRSAARFRLVGGAL